MQHENKHKMPSMKIIHAGTKVMTMTHNSPTKLSEKAQSYVSEKVSHLMRKEGKTQKQALGQAFGMARQKGFRIPKK